MAKQLITKVRRTLLAPALLALIPLVLSVLLPLNQANAVSKTWDGGCGADTTWSCANNWSDNIVPAAGDTVTFNGTSTNNSTVDGSFAGTITTININSGYTGTISLNRSLTVSDTFSQSAGTFTANAQTLAIHTFALSGGSFTASSGTTSISGSMTISGSPIFNANGGTIDLVGSIDSTFTYACNNVNFNLVKFSHDGGESTVNSDCVLPLGNNPSANSAGEIILNGTLSGSGTLTVGAALILGNTGVLSGFSGLSASELHVDGTYDFGSYTTFIVTGAFIVSSGASITMPSGTASFERDFTIDSGATFNANGGTVNFNGNIDATISCGDALFNLVMFTYTGGTKTVGSDCSLPLGNNPTVGNGAGSGAGGTQNNMNGTAATGFGSGGGGAGYYGGMGGDGLYGGGGGGAAGFTATGRFGGAGGNGVVVFSPTGGSDEVRTSGNSWTVPAGVTSVKIWAIGAGGGGAGATNDDSSAGGAGGAGGIVYQTFTVIPGQVIAYSLGGGGDSGIDAANGQAGGNTTVTAGVTTLTANGGAGGEYNTGNAAAGGSFLGGDGGADGGIGSGAGGDTGGGGGGGIGGADGIENGGEGGTGGQANDVSGLFSVLSGLGYATTGPGVGGTSSSGNEFVALVLQGTLSGSGTLTTASDLTLDSGSSLSGFNGLTVTSTGTLAVNGNYNFGTYSTFTVGGAFTLGSGATFTAPSGTASFKSSFINNGGTFNANGGTVVLNGTNQFIIGDTTFYNLTKTVSSGRTLAFAAGSTQTVLGKLTLQGSTSGLLRLVSTASGSPWHINAEGTTNVDYVNVSDSDAAPGKTIVACSSTDSGGNSGWSFNPASCGSPAPPAPPGPVDSGSGSGSGSGAIISSTSALTNFELLQAALIAQNQQNQISEPQFFNDDSLPSKIRNFVAQFPHGKALVVAAKHFLWAVLALLALGLLIGWVLWRRHRRQEEDTPDEYPPIIAPPASWPSSGSGPVIGSTFHPATTSEYPDPAVIHTATLNKRIGY